MANFHFDFGTTGNNVIPGTINNDILDGLSGQDVLGLTQADVKYLLDLGIKNNKDAPGIFYPSFYAELDKLDKNPGDDVLLGGNEDLGLGFILNRDIQYDDILYGGKGDDILIGGKLKGTNLNDIYAGLKQWQEHKFDRNNLTNQLWEDDINYLYTDIAFLKGKNNDIMYGGPGADIFIRGVGDIIVDYNPKEGDLIYDIKGGGGLNPTFTL